MKSKYVALLTLLMLSLCGCNNGNRVTIKGNISNMTDSLILVYGNLNEKNGDNIDTIKAHKGKFTYHVKIDSPTCLYLLFPGNQNERCAVYVSPGDGVKINGKSPDYDLLKVKGGDKANKLLNEFKENIKEFHTDPARSQAEAEKFIRAHKDSPASAFLLDEYFVQSPILSVDKIRMLTNLLQSPATNDPLVKQITTYLNQRSGLAVGSPAPMFSCSTNKGNVINLNDFKGKNVLVHFWASWTSNFGSEASRVSMLKQKCSNDIVFIGISLDLDRNAWKNAIRQFNFTWSQVCDFSGFDGNMAHQFDVTSLPKYILIGTDGRIKCINNDLNMIQNNLTTVTTQK